MTRNTIVLGVLLVLSATAQAECETWKMTLEPKADSQTACESLRMDGPASITSCDGKTAVLKVAKGGEYTMTPTSTDWRVTQRLDNPEDRSSETRIIALDLLSLDYSALKIEADGRGHRKASSCSGKLKLN